LDFTTEKQQLKLFVLIGTQDVERLRLYVDRRWSKPQTLAVNAGGGEAGVEI